MPDLADGYLAAPAGRDRVGDPAASVKAVRDTGLAIATACHEEAEGTAAWLRTRIEVGAAQVLATG